MHDLVAAQEEAARALASLSLDAVRNFTDARRLKMAVEVRDKLGSTMPIRFAFEIIRKQ